MNKKIILIIVIIIIIVFAVYQVFLKKETSTFSTEKVSRGNVTQEVSETGTVKKGEEINLGFKNGGRIEKIYVKVGEEVKSGNVLAKLETTQLNIQFSEAQASLEVAKAQLQVAQTSASNTQIALKTAEQNLNDVAVVAEENLDNAYENTLNILEDAYLKIYNTFETVKIIQMAYFTTTDQESLKVKDNKDKIQTALNQTKSYLDSAKTNPTNINIDTAISEIKKSLEGVSAALTIIRQVCEESSYQNTVSSANKTALDNQRTNINTALTNVTNSQQTISSIKINNETNINTAKSQVLTAEGNLKGAQENINLVQAQVKQAEAQLNLLRNQIGEAVLFSPADGQITKINKKVGETVVAQLSDPVFSFLSAGPFQIETDIYEEDVVKVKVGNPVDIKLTAFPNQTFSGKVISIDPAEKLIEGVVYYGITIDFQDAPAEIKPGMTADIIIKTALKDNVLMISAGAIEKRNGDNIVQVLKGKNLEERKIEIGLKGSNDMVEIVSGLNEGEEIAVAK